MKSKILILVFFMLLWGCAARKSAVDIYKTVEKDNSSIKKSTEGTTKQETKSDESNVIKKDKEKTETTTKTEESFNPDGSINKRTTTTTNKKSTDKSTQNFRRTITNKKDSTFRTSIDETHITYKTVYNKQKQTSANNYVLYIVLGVVVILGLYLLYRKFK